MSIKSELEKTASYLRSLRTSIVERGGDVSDTAGLEELVEAVKTITPTIGLTYELSDDGSYYVCTGTGTSTEDKITIASKVNGLPVSEIGYGAFRTSSYLTSVVIPNSVTTIFGNSFSRCALTHIEIPSSVQEIKLDAFNACRKLTSIRLHEGLQYLGGFANCEYITNIDIPSTVISVGERAFYNCLRLLSVVIPENVSVIGTRAFDNCSNLITVTVKNKNVPTLGTNAFRGCPISEIRVPTASLTAYKSATNWSAYADVMVGYEEDEV